MECPKNVTAAPLTNGRIRPGSTGRRLLNGLRSLLRDTGEGRDHLGDPADDLGTLDRDTTARGGGLARRALVSLRLGVGALAGKERSIAHSD